MQNAYAEFLTAKRMLELNHLHPTAQSVASPNGMLAIFYERETIDNYDNDVTRIEFPDGTYFRMVHLTDPSAEFQRATIYGAKGKFVRVSALSQIRDDGIVSTWIDIANFKVWWLNGVNYKVMGPDGIAENLLMQKLRLLNRDNYNAVIIDVLEFLSSSEDHWQYKSVEE